MTTVIAKNIYIGGITFILPLFYPLKFKRKHDSRLENRHKQTTSPVDKDTQKTEVTINVANS
jgi:hypothetical protein